MGSLGYQSSQIANSGFQGENFSVPSQVADSTRTKVWRQAEKVAADCRSERGAEPLPADLAQVVAAWSLCLPTFGPILLAMAF